jgi:hypothetical protein
MYSFVASLGLGKLALYGTLLGPQTSSGHPPTFPRSGSTGATKPARAYTVGFSRRVSMGFLYKQFCSIVALNKPYFLFILALCLVARCDAINVII